ncbi:phosphatase PAP2 family protein [Fusibacter ferrireducens]|uniref:Phosphatase PAP2 family protein n=1 Tax=Fusibacter ferrireducens TaxID=2785058 RepID=A0ABR9ZUM7_9FIRM|nr:phosphatase PAP2 family protein [Fusibacter ferrireducens]MBF4693585.1 phosphatase PAP2 family protein [Fusibacter ferrireducens]
MPIEIDFIMWLQRFSSPFLDRVFEVITILGEAYTYIFLLSLLYWCVDKTNSRRILLAMTLSVALNGILKEIFNAVRPIGVEGIRSLRTQTATGASFPSGHTQTIATFIFSIIIICKNKIINVLGFFLIIAVATSRLYLGVHWPKDVIAAILIALVIVKVAEWMHDRAYRYSDFLSYFIILAIAVVTLFIFKTESYYKGVAILLGYIVGYWIEENFVNFDARGALDRQIIKYIIGMTGLLLTFIGLKIVLPDTPSMIFMRYFMTLLWATAGAPALFVVLRLSKHRIF